MNIPQPRLFQNGQQQNPNREGVSDTFYPLPSSTTNLPMKPILSDPSLFNVDEKQEIGQPLLNKELNPQKVNLSNDVSFDLSQGFLNGNSLDSSSPIPISYVATNTESTASAKSYISMNEEFLASQEESWNKKNPLAKFDFMTEPTEEWAKQIVYTPTPFRNVIQAGSTVIDPNVFFSLYTPEETELRQMLNSITLEKDALHLQDSTTQTQVKTVRKPSEPFSKPAVTRNEKLAAASLIQQNGILPVNQFHEVSNQTILPEFQIDLSKDVTVEPLSAIDFYKLTSNIPSLANPPGTLPDENGLVGGGSLKESPEDFSINNYHGNGSLKEKSPSSINKEFFPNDPLKDENSSLNTSLFSPPIIPKPISPTLQEPTYLMDSAETPILDRSVETTHFPTPLSPNPPVNPTPVSLYKGSNSDLMGTILFGSKEAAKDILETPAQAENQTLSEPKEFSTVPQVPVSEANPPSPLYSPTSPVNKSSGFSVHDTPSPGIKVGPTKRPPIIAESTVVAFGCVPVHATSHASICLRSTASTTLMVNLSLRSIQSSSQTVFAIQSSPTLSLQPGETTSVVLSYTPFALQEDLALLLVSTSSNPQVIPIVGYGGCCTATVTEKDGSLVIGNSGDRTACFFTLGVDHAQIELIRSSESIPPFFMLPPMMEFSIASDVIRKEIQEKKLPHQIRIIAVDNILRRRLLMAVNRNAMIRCSDPVEILLLHVIKESMEATATTRSLLKTIEKFPVDVNTVDITREIEDGEGVVDLDTLLGREKSAYSHYMDLKMMLPHLMGVSVDLNQISGFYTPHNQFEVDLKNELPFVEPRVENRESLYQVTEEIPSIPFFASDKPVDSIKSSHISVIPQLIYITPGELKRDQISIFNHSTEDVYFSIPDVPQQINISPTQGMIPKLSSFLLTIELSQIGVYQLGRTLQLKLYVDRIDFDVEIRIQPFTDEGPSIEIKNDSSLFVVPQEQPSPFQTQSLPTFTKPVGIETTSFVKVDTVNAIQFEGQAAANKDVMVKDNYISIPAGITTSQLFKTVFYNYSSHNVKVVLDAIQPPFECSYREFSIKPKRKVRVPILFKPDSTHGSALCCVSATVSYED